MPSFSDLSKNLKYKDQAIWFLNGFWGERGGMNGQTANDVWTYVQKFIELDKLQTPPRGADGNELDQFWSAKFLEDFNSTLTAQDRKEALRKIDHDNNGKMSCIEYLVWRYNKECDQTANAPQGDNTAAIAAAQKKLDEVSAQLAECERKLQEQNTAIENNNKAIADLKIKQEELTKAKNDLIEAEKELQAAVDDLKRQEDEIAAKKAELKQKASQTGVSAMKAKNELAQLEGEDPLPLRRAKITQEAAVRRVKKEQAAVEEAKIQVQAKEKELEEVGKQLEEAKRQLEQAYIDLEKKMDEAREELEVVKSNPGGGQGAIWWMERELFEADKSLPTRKQRYDHSKPFDFDPLRN